jgi:hypothetical protein
LLTGVVHMGSSQANQPMTLVFHRTGQRRYAVEAQRSGFPDVQMNPAPGYDALIPHDMIHLVVEAQLGLTRAVFGQLAAGGDAGTFHIPSKAGENVRAIARARTRVKVRGRKLLKDGRDECVQSEQAAHICRHEWLTRSSSAEPRRAGTQLRAVDQGKLDEICEHLDQLSRHWSSLEVGQSMAVAWPSLAILTA